MLGSGIVLNEKRQSTSANKFAKVIMQHLLGPLEWTMIESLVWTMIGPQWKPSALPTGQLSHPVISLS